MFGLTRREQRWKAEQKAAEALIPLISATVRAAAEIRVAEATAEATADAAELERLRAEIARLTAALKRANDQAEHFEREWYLRGDALEAVKEKLKIDDEYGLYDTVCNALLVNAEVSGGLRAPMPEDAPRTAAGSPLDRPVGPVAGA